jgi:hypothetical protein
MDFARVNCSNFEAGSFNLTNFTIIMATGFRSIKQVG